MLDLVEHFRRNGVLSRDDWESVFDTLTKNRECISKREFVEGKKGTSALFMFLQGQSPARSDYLSKEEWIAAFSTVDTNRSGQLDKREIFTLRQASLGLFQSAGGEAASSQR